MLMGDVRLKKNEEEEEEAHMSQTLSPTYYFALAVI